MTIQDSIDRMRLAGDYGVVFEWDKWIDQIPYIALPVGATMKPIPPFHGAVVRFYVKRGNDSHVSVYLDCYDVLGFHPGPYWEIYPDKDGDVSRFAIDDVAGLELAILESIVTQESK